MADDAMPCASGVERAKRFSVLMNFSPELTCPAGNLQCLYFCQAAQACIENSQCELAPLLAHLQPRCADPGCLFLRLRFTPGPYDYTDIGADIVVPHCCLCVPKERA